MEILLIDDHPLLNAGITAILEATGLFTVSAQAESLGAAMNFIENCEIMPNLIVLDMLLGEENGLDFLPMLRDYCKSRKIPKPPVLVCSALNDRFKIHTAMKLGAAGFLSKAGGKAEILKAIDTILRGNVYVSDEVNMQLQEVSDIHAKFSKREIDVINLVKQRKTNSQIAKTLDLNIRTVENYISKIYFKTGYSSHEEICRI